MTQPAEPQGTIRNLPPPSANGSGPSQPAPQPPAQPPPAAAPPAPEPQAVKRAPARTRISGMRAGLIAGFAALTVVLIFIIQNAHAVKINFLGAHLQLSLAVALILAAIAGALVMAAAGTARITQLRRVMRRDRRTRQAS